MLNTSNLSYHRNLQTQTSFLFYISIIIDLKTQTFDNDDGKKISIIINLKTFDGDGQRNQSYKNLPSGWSSWRTLLEHCNASFKYELTDIVQNQVMVSVILQSQ